MAWRLLFEVEYARQSQGRGNAPTLVPVPPGAGGHVQAQVIVLRAHIDEPTATNILYRREIDKVGQLNVVYQETDFPGPNRVMIKTTQIPGIQGIDTVLYTSIRHNIPGIVDQHVSPEAKAEKLAGKALASLNEDTFNRDRDGIRYLADAIRHGVRTPLTEAYRDAILEKAREMTGKDISDLQTARLEIARHKDVIPQEGA